MRYEEDHDSVEGLLDIELSGDEVREILERLGQAEFGGEASKVRDVVEATNADPQTVGRLLADIRKDSFEDKYGLRIEEHEKRIEKLETREPARTLTWAEAHPQPELVRRSPDRSDILAELGTDDRDELIGMINDRRIGRTIGYMAIPFIIVVALVGAVVSGTRGQGVESQSPDYPISITIHDVEITGFPNGPWKAKEHGQVRDATAEEVLDAQTSWLAIRAAERSSGKH